jgi:hypothetical protein
MTGLILRGCWPTPGQLLLVIPGDHGGGNLNLFDEPASGGGIFDFICVERGQISGPLEAVVHCETILYFYRLRLIDDLETAALLLLHLVNGELLCFL